MRRAVQILLIAIGVVVLIAIVGFFFGWLTLPFLPVGLQNRLVALLATLGIAVAIMAGIAQIRGYSVRDLLFKKKRDDLAVPATIGELSDGVTQPQPPAETSSAPSALPESDIASSDLDLQVRSPSQDLLVIGEQIEGDQVMGDKAGGDKVEGDKVGGDKVDGNKIEIRTVNIRPILQAGTDLDEHKDERQTIRYRIRSLRGIKEPKALVVEYWKLEEDVRDSKDADLLELLQNVAREVLTPDRLWAAAEGWFALSEEEWALDQALRCAKLAVEWHPTVGGSFRYRSLFLVLEYQAMSKISSVPLSAEQGEELERALRRLRSECEEEGGCHRATELLQGLGRSQGKLLGIPGSDIEGFVDWVADRPRQPLRRATRVEQWLKAINDDFRFSPFGGEWAEEDLSLEASYVAEVFEEARGRKSVLVVGPPGSGKSATASILARDCLVPLDEPREPGAFPVRYLFPIEDDAKCSQRDHLEWLCRDVAVAVARYVAYDNDGFFRLTEKEPVATLLSLWHESPKHLESQLRAYGPPWETSDRLVHKLPYRPLSPEHMSDQQYLDLLEARPWGFDCIYLLVDPLSAIEAFDAQAVAQCVRRLLELTLRLKKKEVYLKLFLPEEVSRHLGSLHGISLVPLEWNDTRLRAMLQNRLKAASKGRVESMDQLCDPRDQRPDDRRLDKQLIAKAGDSPRQLLRAGQALLQAHVEVLHRGQEASVIPPLALGWALDKLESREENDG